MKSVLLPGQIMFYLRICNFQAQLGTRDIQKFDFKKVLFSSKKLRFITVAIIVAKNSLKENDDKFPGDTFTA